MKPVATFAGSTSLCTGEINAVHRVGGKGGTARGSALARRPEFSRQGSLMKSCRHDGFHSGEGRYEGATETLRYVIVCDICHSELREVHAERYAPEYDAHGNDAYRVAA